MSHVTYTHLFVLYPAPIKLEYEMHALFHIAIPLQKWNINIVSLATTAAVITTTKQKAKHAKQDSNLCRSRDMDHNPRTVMDISGHLVPMLKIIQSLYYLLVTQTNV